MECKKDGRPGAVQCKLNQKSAERFFARRRRRRAPHQIKGYTHHDIKYRPYWTKQPVGWIKTWLLECSIPTGNFVDG